MIENLIKDEINLKRWRRFKANKLALISSFFLLVSIFLTLISPILANSKPLYLNYKGKSYFPVFIDYDAKEFGIVDLLVVPYKSLELSSEDSVLWPIVR